MKISAVIVTCNRKTKLERLLQSLRSQTRPVDEIIVVDNASTDGTPDCLKDRYPDVQLIRNEKNEGLFGGLVKGIHHALTSDSDVIVLIDDDAWMAEDAVAQYLRIAEKDDDVLNGIVYASHLAPDGIHFTEPVWVKIDNHWKVFLTLAPEIENAMLETNFGPNIGVFIPRIIFEKSGLPREDMVFCGEEEFLYRVQMHGFRAYRYFPIRVYHKPHRMVRWKIFGRALFSSVVPPWHTYYETRNRVFVHHYCRKEGHVRFYLSLFIQLLMKITHGPERLRTFRYFVKGLRDGRKGKLGMKVPIPRPTNRS